MIKAKYILISFFTAGVLTFGSLPAMSQEIIGENSFGIDVSDIETDRNFVEAFNDGYEAVDDVEKDEIASLRFVWNTPVNMASYVRNGKIWVVFDHQNKFDIDVLKAEAGAMAKEIYYLFHLVLIVYMSSHSFIPSPVKLPLSTACSTSISRVSMTGDSYLSFSIIFIL